MIRLSLTEEAIKELDYQRYHHPHPRVQKKMEVVLLKARGLSNEQIAHCVGICQNTVRSYLREYKQGGIETLKQVRFRQPQSELQEHKTTLEAHFRVHPPTSIAQAAQVIEQLTGIKSNVVELSHPDQYSKPIAEHIAQSGAYDILDIEPAWTPSLAILGPF